MENSRKARTKVFQKRRILSIAKKLEIIEYFDKSKLGLSDVARELNLPRQYLANLLKDKQKYRQYVSEGRNIRFKNRSVLRKHLPLENAMKLFAYQAMNNNVKLTVSDISNKALIFGIKLGLKDFKACGGWVAKFVQRHKVHVTNAHKKNSSYEPAKHEEISPTQLELIGQYCTKDIYSIAKFGLFYKCLPEHTDILYSKTCRDGSLSEQRFTVVCSANMDGTEKLPLLVIGDEKQPASFKYLQSLPVDYTSACKSWMNWDVFRSWILKLDAKFQKDGRNVLVFAQDYGNLKHTLQNQLKAINLQFLSTPFKKRPFDYGVITELKRSYRHNIVKWSRENYEQTKPRCLTTLDSIDMLARCWTIGVSPETIQNGFKKTGFPINDEDPLDATFHLSEGVEAKANMEPWFDKYCAVDRNVACQGVLSDADILQIVKGEGNVEASCAENYSEDGESREPTIQSDLQTAIEDLSRSLQHIKNVPTCMFEHLNVVEDFFEQRGKLKGI
ncbi:tigger transposable element-derived protein 4-like [Anopheles cruzii]|uniref:tigger transposable element-derived protein 4-like n=1 Tax=Anopheles cruzii TaxID=68878 RepID=UPI0022EC280E|nr:tigger transposable element-derived protein 4-like [Anopheles cruzii]